jgi:hypothetical protein
MASNSLSTLQTGWRQRNAQVVPILGSLLTPAAVASAGLGLWRLGSDLNWTREFVIAKGLFSHWQVWMALAVGLQVAASHLKNSGPSDRPAQS